MKHIKQNHTQQLLLLGALCMSVSSCVPHLSKAQCQSMNWHQLGYNDGSNDHPPRNLKNDIQDCAKFKIKVNTGSYHSGWAKGARDFCQPATAYNLGVHGMSFIPICPTNTLAEKFNAAYKNGLLKYCTAATGYNLGRAGQPNPGFCPSAVVNRFDNAYNRGYLIYQQISGVQSQINGTQDSINDSKSRIDSNNKAISDAYSEISTAKAGLAGLSNDPKNQAARNINERNISDAWNTIYSARSDNRTQNDNIDQKTAVLINLQRQLSTIQTNTD